MQPDPPHRRKRVIPALSSRARTILGTPVVRRFQRFLVVGLFNTAFSYCLYALFLWLTPLGPQNSLLASFWIGVAWNYFATARFAFD